MSRQTGRKATKADQMFERNDQRSKRVVHPVQQKQKINPSQVQQDSFEFLNLEMHTHSPPLMLQTSLARLCIQASSHHTMNFAARICFSIAFAAITAANAPLSFNIFPRQIWTPYPGHSSVFAPLLFPANYPTLSTVVHRYHPTHTSVHIGQ